MLSDDDMNLMKPLFGRNSCKSIVNNSVKLTYYVLYLIEFLEITILLSKYIGPRTPAVRHEQTYISRIQRTVSSFTFDSFNPT